MLIIGRGFIVIVLAFLLLFVASSIVGGQEPLAVGTELTWIRVETYGGSMLIITKVGDHWLISSWTTKMGNIEAKLQFVKGVSYGIGRPWRFPLRIPTPTPTPTPGAIVTPMET